MEAVVERRAIRAPDRRLARVVVRVDGVVGRRRIVRLGVRRDLGRVLRVRFKEGGKVLGWRGFWFI